MNQSYFFFFEAKPLRFVQILPALVSNDKLGLERNATELTYEVNMLHRTFTFI